MADWLISSIFIYNGSLTQVKTVFKEKSVINALMLCYWVSRSFYYNAVKKFTATSLLLRHKFGQWVWGKVACMKINSVTKQCDCPQWRYFPQQMKIFDPSVSTVSRRNIALKKNNDTCWGCVSAQCRCVSGATHLTSDLTLSLLRTPLSLHFFIMNHTA